MDLVVPALGESISEAVIAKWLKKVGDTTAQDEPVVDLETDKVSVQLPAPARGVLVEQRFAEGATVKVGEVIGRIGEAAATPSPQAGAPSPQADAPSPQAGAATASLPPTTKVAQEMRPEPAPREEPLSTTTAVATAAQPPSSVENQRLTPSQRRALREQDGPSA